MNKAERQTIKGLELVKKGLSELQVVLTENDPTTVDGIFGLPDFQAFGYPFGKLSIDEAKESVEDWISALENK